MKYIDAEKLKVGIRQLIVECIRNNWSTTEYCLRKVLSIIDTLQQEQVSVEKQIAEDKNSIEYVRKDAFIEKAQNFFRQSNYLFNLDGKELHNLIDDFRKYMKGE